MKRGGAITIISFLLVAVTSSAVVSGVNEFVRDHMGMPVKPNTLYYVRHSFRESHIWLCLETYDSETSCPERLVVSTTDYEPRAKIMFILPEEDTGVRLSTELNIRVQLDKNCSESGYWRDEDSSAKIKEVVLKGSKSSNDSIYTIQKSAQYQDADADPIPGRTYKFAFGSADNPTDVTWRQKVADVHFSGVEAAFFFILAK